METQLHRPCYPGWIYPIRERVPEMAKNKKFHLFDAILSVICVVFVCEAAAPAAAIGNSQYFWWIFLIILFLLPYGMIVSELGSAYPDDEGGIYDWVKRAFGDRWAARTSWFYWINFPLWIASLAILFPETINLLTGGEMGVVLSLVIELAFVWIVVFLSFSKVSDSGWIINLGAVLKVLVALLLGVMGIIYVTHNGFANAGSIRSYFPDFSDTSSLTYLSIILFNFMGFEVLATYTGSMENPAKQIPKAIIAGGIAIAVVYLISSFGIGAAIPAEELTVDSGIMDAVGIMAGNGSLLFILVGIIFLVTLFGNMVSWSFGVNYVADHAAQDHNMPKVFGIESKKNGMPIGAALMNGIVASVLCVVSVIPGIGGDSGFFWVFFATQIVFLLLAYVPMFPAFLKLRKTDPDRVRPFRVPGKGVLLMFETWVPVVLLVLAVIATMVPLNTTSDELDYKIPILVCFVVFAIVGEVVRIVSARGRQKLPVAGSDDTTE